MYVEKPFEFIRCKNLRLHSLSTFSNAVERSQKLQYPTTLKTRHDLLTQQQDVLRKICAESTERALQATILDVAKFVQNFPSDEIRRKFPFVPTLCLHLNECFADSTEILNLIETKLPISDETPSYFVRFGVDVNSVKTALYCLYSNFVGRKPDSNFSGSMNDVMDLYEKSILSRENCEKPVIIAFSQILSLDRRVFNDILHILCTNFRRFPVLLLLPVVGGPFALNSSIGRDVVQNLNITTISLPKPVELLDNFLYCLLSNSEFVKIDILTYNLLNTGFRQEFSSLKRYVDGLRLLLLEHYCDEPFSVFSCPPKQLEKIFKVLNFDQFALDFSRTPTKSPPKRMKSMLNIRLTDETRKNLFKFNDFSKAFFGLFQCFHDLCRRYPALSKRTLCESYANFFDPGYFAGEEFRLIMESMNLTDIQSFLNENRYIFDQENSSMSTEVSTFFNEHLKRFENLDDYQRTLDAKRENLHNSQNGPVKKRTRQDLQNQLLDRIRTKHDFDGFQICKKQFFDGLIDKFAKFGCESAANFFAENDNTRRSFFLKHQHDGLLTKFLNLSVRRSVKTALLSPYHFAVKDDENSRKINFQLDCCIIFERYVQCAPSVCTRTLLKHFMDNLRRAAAEEPAKSCRTKRRHFSNKNNNSSASAVVEDEAIRARFYKILAEFEYLGLIKYAPRKKNSITRLLFAV